MLVHERDVAARLNYDDILPVWRWAALYGFEGNRSNGPLLWSEDRDGNRDEVRFSIAGAGLINLISITGGTDGAMAVHGTADSPDSRGATFIAWISPDRKQQTVIRVWPYVPWRVAISADGVIWAAGYLKDAANTRIVENNIIRRYDRSGAMLGSLNVQVKPIWAHSGPDATEDSYLMPARAGVGWVTNTGEYIEFGPDGRELARFAAPPVSAAAGDPRMCGAALGQGGELLACIEQRNQGKRTRQIFALDRISRSWRAALPAGNDQVALAGFDGETPIIIQWPAGGAGVVSRYRLDTVAPGGAQ
jgi:hypothetical protein